MKFEMAVFVVLTPSQALAAKLGCVTGLNLAEMNRKYLPRWANIALWALAEAAIVCTDVGQVILLDSRYPLQSNMMNQVIGTAIAINLLCPKIPLIAGCALSVVDALVILLFYRPDGKLRVLRAFEYFIGAIVLGVVICFCIDLSMISAPAGQVFKGFLPSRTVFVSEG
jgi:metal iron transporter